MGFTIRVQNRSTGQCVTLDRVTKVDFDEEHNRITVERESNIPDEMFDNNVWRYPAVRQPMTDDEAYLLRKANDNLSKP